MNTTKQYVETLTVGCVAADEVKIGDHVMTPTGPKAVLSITPRKTGRLEIRYGKYTVSRFLRQPYEPVYVLVVTA